jgi:RNA polymerase-binding transcription factor DksA
MASKNSAPKKAVAKKPVKAAPAKKAAKPEVKKAIVASKPSSPVAKKPEVKKVAPAKKAAPVVVKKPTVSNVKKPVEKSKPAPVKAAPAKKATPAAKPAPVKASKSPVASKTSPTKTPAKPTSTAKAVPVKAAPKETPIKPAPKPTPAKPVKEAKPKAEKTPKPKKSAKPVKKIIIAPITAAPKKIDAFKTSTFGTANLKNETGKVIAHRKTSELKRKTEDLKPKKYIPELSRSILDMSNTNNTTSYRYSDEDLQEFRDLIQRKLDTAKAELQYLQGVIMRKDESGTEDTENKYQNMEDGSASMDREQINQLASRQITFISHLEQALVRIENKTYGICRETGKLIDKARLRAVPHATLSIEAKNAKKN